MVNGTPFRVRAGHSMISVTVPCMAGGWTVSGAGTGAGTNSVLWEDVRDGAPPAAVGSKVTHPRSENPTSAHWWAWELRTVCVPWVWSMAHPDTTRAGIPTDRAINTKALLN